MSERNGYNPGEFCWVDIAVPDTDAAIAYYGDLLGWNATSAGPVEVSGGYGFFDLKGKMTAGYGPTQNEYQPPAWTGYITMASADETVAKVSEAGGTVVFGPDDLPENAGRMAVCQDAEGAFFNVLQLGEHKGAALVNEVGTWTWNQLSTRDLDKAIAFYGHVFGWSSAKAPDAPANIPYSMWHVEGQRWEEGLAGIMEMGDTFPAEVPPHWMVFFAVADAQVACTTTTAAGGQVTVAPERIPVGTLAVLVDPQGANLGIIQPDYPEAR